MTKKKRVDTEDEQDEGDWVDVKEEKFESTRHHEERKARIEAENEVNAKVNKDLAENQEIANFKGLPQEGETREQLLDRIRKLRENPPHVEVELFRSEGLQKEYEAEVKAGQEAVAKATAQAEELRASAAKIAAGEKNQAG
jgi:SepF-like predicted cell division protein (DUF552 family)